MQLRPKALCHPTGPRCVRGSRGGRLVQSGVGLGFGTCWGWVVPSRQLSGLSPKHRSGASDDDAEEESNEKEFFEHKNLW